ncbi:helix-turn-helix transcriptional regulator [Jannaschia sp. W003]|uniref:ArsR/SmtB family transcription factor n=1 Tax=Jannaschia sp. W003 TaxID=2867012 RepID=UPI0021A38F35|nr:metalloregulator ArsR/SmtB family transcription factor [Jannaschia sp. W003]UWQ22440.1 metalloregulator ArsR/SmtB family transcription factor [Jannaschia sp. W003]
MSKSGNANIGGAVPEALAERADRVAARLGVLANAKRLLILCHLMQAETDGSGEMTVGALQRAVDLSQSALSQHLARLRDAGIVATRREAQTIHYRIDDPEMRRMMAALYDVFCRGA